MKILVVVPVWGMASQLWLYRSLQFLKPHVAAVFSLTPPDPAWSGGLRTVHPAGPPPLWERGLRRAGVPARWFPGREEALLERAVKDRSVDAVLIHFLDMGIRFLPVLEKSSKPVFVHGHGPMDIHSDYRDPGDPGRRVQPLDHPERVVRLARRAVLIANSRWTAEKLAAMGVPAGRIAVKHLGVPVPVEPPRRDGRRGLNVLYLNRLVDWKSPDRTIRAFELACDRGFEGTLTVAGDGPLRPMCELLRARSPYAERIRLAGEVDAAQGEALRAGADIFTAHHMRGELSRAEEAFGVSVVEAMAAGLPVVTGRSGALPETVIDGETGFLVEPGDVEAHANALLRLGERSDLRLAMGRRGWERARELFTIEGETERLLRIIASGGETRVSAGESSTPELETAGERREGA